MHRFMENTPDLYVGLMSGTSLDGVDAALLEITPHTSPRLLATHAEPMPTALREMLLTLCHASSASFAELAAAEDAFCHLQARAVSALLVQQGLTGDAIAAIGSHGQTVRHRPGGETPFTLQIGNPDLIAERTGICVVADFRGRDLAAGGQGAPLVPAFHRALFAADVPRVVVNIGGMANLTLLPDPDPARVGGFDTGPGNVLIDAWARRHLQAAFDEDGLWACQGRIDPELLDGMLEEPYFHAPAPKSTGRERFDEHWLDARLTAIGATRAPAGGAPPVDPAATPRAGTTECGGVRLQTTPATVAR
jgi:anhydro-N-acetylmuramic acid kinase